METPEDATSVACCVPVEGICHGTNILGSHLHKAIKVLCSSKKCDQSGFIHASCFSKWEQNVFQDSKIVSKLPNPAQYSEKYLIRSMWSKSGYHHIQKFCSCLCGGGYLRYAKTDNLVKVGIKKISLQPNFKIRQKPNHNDLLKQGLSLNPKIEDLDFIEQPINLAEEIGTSREAKFKPEKNVQATQTPTKANIIEQSEKTEIKRAVPQTENNDSNTIQMEQPGKIKNDHQSMVEKIEFIHRPIVDMQAMQQIEIPDKIKINDQPEKITKQLLQHRDETEIIKKLSQDPVEASTLKEIMQESETNIQQNNIDINDHLRKFKVIEEPLQLSGNKIFKVDLKESQKTKCWMCNSNTSSEFWHVHKHNGKLLCGDCFSLRKKKSERKVKSVEVMASIDSNHQNMPSTKKTFSKTKSIFKNNNQDIDVNCETLEQFVGIVINWDFNDGCGFIYSEFLQTEIFFNSDVLPASTYNANFQDAGGVDSSNLQESEVVFTAAIGLDGIWKCLSINKIYPEDGNTHLGKIIEWNSSKGWGQLQDVHQQRFGFVQAELVDIETYGFVDLTGSLVECRIEARKKWAKKVNVIVPGPSCSKIVSKINCIKEEEADEESFRNIGVAGLTVKAFTPSDLSRYPKLKVVSKRYDALQLAHSLRNMTIGQKKFLLKELQEFWSCLAAHPTGHYAVHSLLCSTRGIYVNQMVEILSRDFLDLSKTKLGSETLISAIRITTIAPGMRSRLVSRYMEVQDPAHLLSCLNDRYGSAVFVESLAVMDMQVMRNILFLLTGNYKNLSTHSCGFFSLRKLIEHLQKSNSADSVYSIALELEPYLMMISHNKYGRFVVKSLLKTSVPVSALIFQQLSGAMGPLSISCTTATVVATILTLGTDSQIHLVVNELCGINSLTGEHFLVEIARRRYCKSVLLALLQSRNLDYLEAIYGILSKYRKEVVSSEQASHFMQELDTLVKLEKRYIKLSVIAEL